MPKVNFNDGYVEGLKKALQLVDERARFGIDKLISGISEEIKEVKKEQNDKKNS